MSIIGTVLPQDENFIEAERQCKAPIDYIPEGPGLVAVRSIAEKLRNLGVTDGTSPQSVTTSQVTGGADSRA